MNWGSWQGWNAANASGYPYDVCQGDIVQADLIIGVSRVGDTPQPAFIPGYVFQVETAESFLLVPDCAPISTHIVAPRYRVWDSEPDIDCARQAAGVWQDTNRVLSAAEEELLRQLIGDANQKEAA
jgi:hypothetical protein